jgi:hypothetical protein
MHGALNDILGTVFQKDNVRRQDLMEIVGTRLDSIYQILNTRMPGKVAGDSDGDGIRNGSYQDAQKKKEKKQQREQAVREAVDAKAYKINVDRVMPMKGGSKHLTSDYSLEIRNDSVYSYLPYFGVAYNVPYGGGKGLNFSAPLSEYTSTYSKKGNAKITLKVRNEEDNYLYNITIYPNGSSNIQVTPTNRQSISFSGEMDLKKKE